MIERQVEYPVTPDELWRAVTEPDHLDEWFGGHLDWEPAPGSPFTFTEDNGARWSGVVVDVDPGRSLRFTWWPDEDPCDASTVGFDIEKTEGGAGLRITETRCEAPGRPRRWGVRAASLAAVCAHRSVHA